MKDLVIGKGRTSQNYWGDLWHYRELFVFLAWRDILVRYKQTAAGLLWAIFQPLVTMVVFFVFGHLASTPTDGAPRALMVLAGILPWQFFASAVGAASGSLVGNSNLISKVYFPRVFIPLAALSVSVVDFLIIGFFLLVAMGILGQFPDCRIVAMPFFLLLTAATALGSGLWFTALNVKYRDFRFIVPFLLQIGIFLCPIAFSSSLVSEQWRWLYFLNPVAVAVEGFRWSLLGGRGLVDPASVIAASAIAGLLVVSGLSYFRRTERGFADVI